VCAACGQVAIGPVAGGRCPNLWCSWPGRPLQAVFAAGPYQGALRRAIVAYKYGGDRRWADVFARMLLGFLERHACWFEEFTVMCPVPSYVGPGARRGWSPVETFCTELGVLGAGAWPVEALVAKLAETSPLSGKPGPARRKVMAQSKFAVPRPSAVEGSRVLLVDDVCTSGGTLLTVSCVLKAAGALEVSALVLARARWRGQP